MARDLFCCALVLALCLLSSITVVAEPWPYNRHLGEQQQSGKYQPNKNAPEYVSEPSNHFLEWLSGLVSKDDSSHLRNAFSNGEIPSHVNSVHDLLDHVNVPDPNEWERQKQEPAIVKPPLISNWSQFEANRVFSHLGFPLDPRCTIDRNKWWYRTYDGSCNWLKVHEISQGQTATAKSRDYNQYSYADGISKPRDGPNPRAVSNAFFRRNQTIYYEHTPLLLGLIEFIMHDVTWSQDSSTEYIDVPMPPDEADFPPNTTLRVWRTAAVPGTGTSKSNPRENINMATTWLDLSSLYGSTAQVAKSLRSFRRGKLLAQSLTTRGRKVPAEYLPYNTMHVPTRTRPGVDPSALFAGGDPRTNEDWVMLAVHTLLLREHNRLCDKLAGQHPEYDDERLYQTVRLVMSAKIQLIANSYQMAYWTDAMPWPRDDGFPLFREMHDESFLDIGPANVYPWPLVTRKGKPMTVSAEMAVVYRFHEFIIPGFPIKDASNRTLWEQNLFETGFDAKGFVDAGLENVVRGILSTSIPNFKSGVDEAFRTAGKYRGAPFDIVTTSIVHEREQGLPTFNQYFTAYNAQDPAIPVRIRASFSDFSSNPSTVSHLRRLYSSADEVDLVVGVQLDEDLFPGTTIPLSAAITSLFSLFASGNSDRFGVGYAAMRCLLVDRPWDCAPSNALEELLWKSSPREGFPNFRWYDADWVAELDLQAHGANLLWRLVAENTDVRCLQRRPLFPFDEETNPVVCRLEEEGVDMLGLATMGAQVVVSLVREHVRKVWGCVLAGVVGWVLRRSRRM